MINSNRLFTSSELDAGKTIDLVCFSHLRWDFVFQRPQHLLTRCARDRRVFFIEEPVFGNGSMRLDVRDAEAGVRVVVPTLPEGLRSEIAINAVMKEMTRQLFQEHNINEYVFWYYTPMALKFTDHFNPVASVYDCMDELSAFKGAHSQLSMLEKELFQNVDLVFTGGQSLYEAKCGQHPAVYAFPSSIDASHFGKARTNVVDPEDQASIPHPRLGFFGVIDERFDSELLDQVAAKRPDWQFIMIGPVVKIDPESLPKHPNIHYLGPKKYNELPDYLAGWDIALLLFARNDSTRFISPTKTPEYLAAGKPVISTSIRDVVRPYGELKLVEITDTADEFIQAAEKIMARSPESDWLNRVDAFLENISWDKTWTQMSELIEDVIQRRRPARSASLPFGNLSRRAGAGLTT
ncbi:MAG TPA: glycosyltransferase family 1 protein [Pyrinomonadaceae bacterium]|nr:glycosyltransferase family 1 protein [Pyrinomonadaceae bacterium]